MFQLCNEVIVHVAVSGTLGYPEIGVSPPVPEEKQAIVVKPRFEFRYRAGMTALAMLILSCMFPGDLAGWQTQGSSPKSSRESTLRESTTSRQLEVEIGVEGHVRLGCWAEMRIKCEPAPEGSEVLIRAMDSDGNAVDYRWPLTRIDLSAGDGTCVYLGLFRIGRRDQPIEVTVRDPSGAVWAGVTISPDDSGLRVHSANDRLWLYLGPELELRRSLGWVENDPQAGAYRLLHLKRADALPMTVWGWDSFERFVGCSDGQVWPQELQDGQRTALGHWLFSGGRVSLALRASWESLFGANGTFRDWLNGQTAQPSSTTDSSQIELFVTSRTQLIQDPKKQSLAFIGFDTKIDQANLAVGGKPVLIRNVCGLGQLDLLGFNPQDELFEKWPSLGALLTKWLDYRKPEAVRLATTYGYSDVTGRLRSALEQFSRVQVISFTAVALIILGFVALLVADYFFLKHLLREMKWAWITLPICCVSACIATYFLYRYAKPDKYQLNQVELIDIDGTGGLRRSSGTESTLAQPTASATGRVWASLYSPGTDIVDLNVGGVRSLSLTLTESNLGWLGLPGTGLGGMESANRLSGLSGTYEISGRWESTSASGRPTLQTHIAGMPLHVASSRVVTGSWSANFPALKSELRRQAGRDRLSGTFTNPLPFELKDCLIVYGSWGYRLNRPLAAGETIDLAPGSNQAKPESFEDWLRRPNPNVDDLYRNLELLMFYEQAGGVSQSRLLPGYQNRIDLSHVSRSDRAVLIGRHEGYFTELQLDGQPFTEEQRDRHATTFRIIFPVE
ncbi:MAG: hypothetical protein JNL67_12375 [Planctomycetaceae bacterium]|nr:hypothetical protein [Planctomycetaceae bacterium]